MQLSESVVAVFLLVLLAPAPVNTQQARCENVTSGKDTGGSCSFQNQQLCGWTNMADRDQLDWKLEDNSYLGQNSYMVMDVSRASAGNVGYFASPTFCSTGSDLRSLSFRYSIEMGGRCRLSVMLVTEADAIEMWSTSTATGVSFSDMVDPIYFRCPGDRFKIVFVGEKLSNRRCGKYYNEVDIDDISYSSTGQSRTQGYVCAAVSNVTSPPTTTATSPTTTSTTTAPSPVSTPLPPVTGVTDDREDSTQFPRNSTQHGQSSSQTDANGGLSGGAIAGVVIVVIVLIAAVVVVIGIFLVRRKRAEAKKKTNQPPIQHGNSISNSMYMLARLHPGTAGNRPDVIPSAPPPDDDTPIYNVPDNADFAPIYSVPDDLDLDLPSAPSRSSQEPPGYELSAALRPSDSDTGAGSLYPAKGGTGKGLSADSCRKGGDSRYNELNLRGYGPQPNARKSGDTYDRLDQAESGKETGQAPAFSDADNEYSLVYEGNDATQNPQYMNSKAVSQQNNEYSLASDNNNDHSLAGSVNDDNIQRNEYSLAAHPGSADSTVGEARKVTENDYANVQNSGVVENDSSKTDQYNRLDFEEGAGRRIGVPGEKAEYYNACERNENYDHLQQGGRGFQGAGDSVYRNLGFEENEYEI